MQWIHPVLWLASSLPLLAQAEKPAAEQTKTPSEFVRFVKVGDGGHLDTAITTYQKGDVELTLFGAVHIADAACYATLNDRFTNCDVLLYELVAPEDVRPTKDREQGFNPLSMLQQGLKNSLELRFQLDEIDYQAPNFVHADMTPQEFADSMAEKGESILSIMLDMMMSGMRMQQEQQASGKAEPAADFDLVRAFQKGEGRHLMRMTFGQQMSQIEELSAGGKDGTLLQGRNQKCLSVLTREMAKGHKKIGIYYGAAHYSDMERRLINDMGFVKTGQEWIVAWDCAKRPDKKLDRALLEQRRRCRDELKVLMAAGRSYRIEQDATEPIPPKELRTKEHDGRPAYEGPLQDPWGNDYVLQKRPSGVRWQAVSAGPDGKLGTDDDLVEVEARRGGLLDR